MLKDLVRANRSYRGYDESYQFTKEELSEFVDYARLCPSSVNVQPFRYYLAWEKEDVAAVQVTTGWAKGLPDIKLPHEGMCPTGFIVICQDTTIFDSLARFQRDLGIVAQTMLLAAAEKGLGGCMIGSFNAKDLKENIKLADHLAPLLVVAFGKPAETIVLKEINEGESTKYYRDENDVHYVPKRKLEDIIL